MTKHIPAGTLVRINYPDNNILHQKIGYIVVRQPYRAHRILWYTVGFFDMEGVYDFDVNELEVLP